MVITYDIGDTYDIHPKNKREFAHRLAEKALALNIKSKDWGN
jgi:hypothetical protein